MSLRADDSRDLVEPVRDDLSNLIMVRHSDHDDQVDRTGHRIDLTDTVERGDLLRDLRYARYLGFHENDRSDHAGHFNLELSIALGICRRRHLSQRKECSFLSRAPARDFRRSQLRYFASGRGYCFGRTRKSGVERDSSAVDSGEAALALSGESVDLVLQSPNHDL